MKEVDFNSGSQILVWGNIHQVAILLIKFIKLNICLPFKSMFFFFFVFF